MKRAICSFAAFLIISLAFAQEPQEPKDLFLDAEYFMLYEAYLDALPGYLRLLENDPKNANLNYRAGVCYLNIPGQKARSVAYLEEAVKNTTAAYREGNFSEKRAPLDAYFYLANAYLIQNDFTKASRTYTKYLEYVDPADTINVIYVRQQIKACQTAESFKKKPVYFDRKLLSENINDENRNFNPLISGDQKTLIYMTTLKFYDAIYLSKKEGDQWMPPVDLTPQVQSDGDLFTSALSFSGNELYLAKNDQFNSDLYSSKLINGVWTTATKLNKNINTKFWESHAGISPDGKILFFTSNRKGSIGGLDIYKSVWDESAKDWGPAINLGPVINTPFNEDTPFLTESGNTLYFSSQGHENMGGFDIFYSVLDADGSWTKPVNLGYPINTTDDDLFFVPVNNGINALYALYDPESGAGQEDIYYLEIYSDRNPREVKIKGLISLLDKPAGSDKPVTIRLIDKASDETLTLITSDPGTGDFSYKTKKTGDFEAVFESEGYHPVKKGFQVPIDYSLAEVIVNAELKPEAAEYIILQSIFFDFDKYNIKPGERDKLDQLAEVMSQNPDLEIEITGHTDAKGSDAYNQRLSVNRANAVTQFLTARGINKGRLKATGAGETRPIAINTYADGSDCPDGRELNRRVDMNVLATENKSIIGGEVTVPDKLKIK